MSTGALAIVLSQTPNQFDGLRTIGKVIFILDVSIFALLSAAMATRFVLVPQKFIASLHHPMESLFFGTYWVSGSLILNGIQNYGVPSTGPWLIKFLEVTFWMYCTTALLLGVFQYHLLFQKESLPPSSAMPSWIFPIYPLLVVGSLASSLIPSQPQSARLPMWIGALMLQGTGWLVASLIYTIYIQRLMSNALPDPPSRPAMFISVGPAGYTAAALLALGRQAPSVLGDHHFGVDSVPVGDVAKIMATLSGLFVILFAFWFFCMSTVAVLAGVRKMTFTLNWWAFVFPNAGLTLAAIEAGDALDSPGIGYVCSALTLGLVVMWFVTAFAHIRAVYKGQILWPGKDEDSTMQGIPWGRRID
ncbi:hypothetical protein CAC42_7554 [Sphaceloma murrayae]|uniref:Malic acid transport protein n=1 Tax=Sphaceloma murrayae TaxID=2082308 RepID=A0A2K1QXK1_9PEZI|nr:hypothetical protein CAC42_7554 [Sphaceloma murrayae]